MKTWAHSVVFQAFLKSFVDCVFLLLAQLNVVLSSRCHAYTQYDNQRLFLISSWINKVTDDFISSISSNSGVASITIERIERMKSSAFFSSFATARCVLNKSQSMNLLIRIVLTFALWLIRSLLSQSVRGKMSDR